VAVFGKLAQKLEKTAIYKRRNNTRKNTETQNTHNRKQTQKTRKDHKNNIKNIFLIPLQAWTDPEGPRRLRLPDFKTIGTLRW